MNWTIKLLKRLGIMPNWTEDEFINATMDDALKEHEQAVQAVTDATVRRHESNARLRCSIHEARMRNAEFEVFERAIRHIDKEYHSAQ